MTDKQDDEVFLVSSDTESDWGDENRTFYDEESLATKEVKNTLRNFDRDNGQLSNVYQERFVPRLQDRSHNFLRWLIDTDLICSSVICPNAENDPKCNVEMEIVLALGLCDLYQLRCKNCSKTESIRKSSIFYGLKCNLRNVIRILYGWVKGVDLELMANILGLDRKVIGTVYNRAANIAKGCMYLCPGLADVGGEDVVVLVDIYPFLMESTKSLMKSCTPILCISEIESIPQKYWLAPLPLWDKNNPTESKKVKQKVLDSILKVVKMDSVLVLPKKSIMSFDDSMDVLLEHYLSVKYMDDLHNKIILSSDERPLKEILNTIWETPLTICEQAQYFNPDYIGQFLIKHVWNEMTEKDSFIMLISFIVYETRKGKIESYFVNVD